MRKFNFKLDSDDSSTSLSNVKKSVKPEIRKKLPPIKKRIFFDLPSADHRRKSTEFIKQIDSSTVVATSHRPPQKKLPPITNFQEIIDRISQMPDFHFVYLTYSVPINSEYFTPYSLIEVPYDNIDKTMFYTMSTCGVTYWSKTENHFTELNEWLKEYHIYCNIMKIKLFANYRVWKGFKVWQKTIQWKKYLNARNYLEDNLFILTPTLGKAILQLRIKYCEFIEMAFVDVSVIENWHLFYFIEAQMKVYELTKNALIEYRKEMINVLYDACHTAVIAKGFQPDNEALIYTTTKKLREMMTYTDLIRKRRYLILISKFLRYCDYMTISFLHIMLHNSFKLLSSVFRKHDALGPSLENLQTTELNVQIENKRPDGMPQIPLFSGELVLKPNLVEIDPSREVMTFMFNQFIDLMLTSIYNIDRYQSDTIFNQFTEPNIMGKQQDRLCGFPPDIYLIMNNDNDMIENRQFIFTAINVAYDKAEIYVKRFNKIRDDYERDVNTNPETIRNEKDLIQLGQYCERYYNEMNALEGILPIIKLGLLQLEQSTFKEEVIPVCLELLKVLELHLPKIAIEAVEILNDKADEIMIKLKSPPISSLDYVLYMRYVTNCEQHIEKLIKDIDYVYQCFMLMKDYKIFIDDIEKEKYMDCEDLILQCKEVRNNQIDKISEFIEKLAKCLESDIKKLFVEIEDIRSDTVKDWLIDSQSNPADVKETLQNFMERLSVCQSLADDYRSYQKEFRIDITRYDTLEEVLQAVRLRQTLWNSLEEWAMATQKWHTEYFHNLDIEELITMNSKILKNCTLLEKNLPPNEIVPKLRNEAESFKVKLPVLGYLRNQTLKPRHWLKIENILGTKVYLDDTVTIERFDEANAFTDSKIIDSIMEISGQASAEQSLELILKKVDNLWEELELSIVSHRDSKDVFILAGIDDLQLALDETNVNINTIAASRHVGPIKNRVDDWQRQLDCFAETLEEWLTCQTSWIYLEAIFSAPDIQRQLPNESRMFLIVDKSWKDIMRKVQKMPWALSAMTDKNTLELMKRNNVLLEKITRCLEAYLELKRVAFPRFYFLSNDELLEILAQTRNPHAVQPHLRKCFDAIAKLQFATKEGAAKGDPPILLNDILAIVSPEEEKILLGIGLKARGPVEDWLGKVEEAMFIALKRYMKFAYQCYATKDRSEWFQEHPNQIVLTVSQQQWATEVHSILDNTDSTTIMIENNLKLFEKKLFTNLQNLAGIARSDIDKLLRKVLCALITIDVHARDTITNMVKNKVVKSTDFEWLKMLRYYWVPDTQTIEAKMSSACLPYFYEYLGAGGVLVITPLTDRCYLCLMGALQIDLGGAPAGPAGTGKTETTKDLAKALAKQCVVFNCSEGLDYKIMGRFFSGLAQSGAWCCFDEFNRIDIEVLSVIAQQLITIKNAKTARLKRFTFEGREIKLNMSCATFITMNPGYAGRTELPDNLKALFRPIAMMVPDYALIAEVILYSEGFENSKLLAQKMVQMYKLCSEQLSQQDHYDFGMRAVKSVLVMAGALKRAAPNQSEDITLIAALRDSNLPKFLADDAMLFRGILNDLFPGIELKKADYKNLQLAIEYCMEEKNLQLVPELIIKNIQLYETMCVRWGVMLVGPTGGGKTTLLHTLANALSKLFNDGRISEDPNFRLVKIQTLNPKSITLDELYGAVNVTTLEWKDGLLGLAVRAAVNASEHQDDDRHQWIVCDGPVDAVWIENLNTVLDDNKMLCLANSERIKLTAWIHMIFEVEDLAQASPATVSRCGMVYVDSNELGWQPIIKSWCNTLLIAGQLSKELINYLENELFMNYFENCLKYVRQYCRYEIYQVEISKVSMVCNLVNTLIKESKRINTIDLDVAKQLICKLYIWSVLWSIGGNLIDSSKLLLQEFLRNVFRNNDDASLPEDDLWKFKINLDTFKWEDWSTCVTEFKFKSDVSFFDMIIPTTDTTKFGYIAELLFRENQPVMLTGDTGVGKSILAKSVLTKLSENNVISVFLNFSAQTTSLRTQEMIETRLEKRRKTVLGAPIGKKLIIFIDDVNMPKLDTYGSQPSIELLRQFLDFKGFYDRTKMFWKDICDVALGCACAPPGGGRNPLTPRFVRHFALLHLPSPSTETLTTIFSSIMIGFLDEFNAVIRPLALPIVNASVDMYNRIANELLPTPTKSHYVFNLRDLSKCIQGILQADASNYNAPAQILRLFYHESMRVFHDRLINMDDKNYFKTLMKEICVKYFDDPIVKDEECLLFGDFILFGQAKENRIYEEIKDFDKLKSVLFDYLDDFNTLTGKAMKLILFQDAIEHIIRLTRLLRAERGNGLLVGVSGMGKQSLSKLSAHINGYKCAHIELTRGYDQSSFHEDLQKLYDTAGVLNRPTVFVITDTQIVKEEFLEDINNILNSGEVPNLYAADEFEQLILKARYPCTTAKWQDTSRDGIYNFVISRVRANLHIIICMSPVGDALRRRCRMFPSLVNCCTIDWFVKWPSEALLSVAIGSLKDVSENDAQNNDLAKICVKIHESIETISERFYMEYHRHYYTTPSSYLELLKLYHNLLTMRSDIIIAKRNRISNGLNKILETNEIVAVMQEELNDLFPLLEVQSNEMKILLDTLAADNKVADNFKQRVLQDESDARDKEIIARAVADEANKDLEVAQPALIAAQEALKAINKNDINELRSFASPPALVQFVMESVSILFGVKPTWESAKKLMADVNFIKKLTEFNKENISDITLRKIKTYIEHKDFDPIKIEKVSKVAKSVSLWVIAMDKFAKIYKIVEPKIKKSREAENELKQIMAILKQKQAELAEVEAQIQVLKDNIDEKQSEFQIIQDNVNLTTARLNRAGRLTSALSEEEIRWGETIISLTSELWAIPGDVLIASACVAYLGAFPTKYRKSLINLWIVECNKYAIPSSKEFKLVSILGDAYEIRHWNMNYLPKDEISTENGIIVTNALRWPLMIDPQEQANRWIRSIEKENNLRIIKMTDTNLLRILELCIRQGLPLLIEDIEETLDPTLAPILGRQIYSQAGRLLIKLGDSDIDYDNNFKLYMTTKLSNPHYLPEICITVTLVNFLVTESGLEDQLLSYIVAIELPELEKQRSDLIERINSDKQQLLQLEDKVLKLLHSSEGNILDDEELVETLNESKETSVIIAARLSDTEETEAVITEQREKYRILATRGAVIFFVVTSLSEIDPMYQYSLKYFLSIFCNVLEIPHEKVGITERLKMLMADEIYAIYLNVSRGLFERHKLIFSFSLAVAICKQTGLIKESEYKFLLHGGSAGGATTAAADTKSTGTSKQLNVQFDKITLSENAWKNCFYLEQTYSTFNGLTFDLDKSIHIELNDYKVDFIFTKDKTTTTPNPSIQNWNLILNDFQKLLLIKAVAEQNLVNAINSYVRVTLGNHFTTTDGNSSLSVLFADTSSTTPLIFILSTGSDPMSGFLRFTQEQNYMDKLQTISLGQGQGPTAEILIEKGRTLGHWIFLQNCHLATSWMSRMEIIIRNITLGVTKTHPDFRLYLSSMPTKSFPISVLQNSVKFTNEPPKGLKANLIRALDDMSRDYFENHALQTKWCSMVFGLCMFHSIILERRKFGPLGWNITYEFNESDRECGLKTLDMYCNREIVDKIPWDALEYINGEITWGGRVTDYWDQRCLRTILKIFSSEQILNESYQYSDSGLYKCPKSIELNVYRKYVTDDLPFNENPEIFGMNENADLVFKTKETHFFINTLLQGQPLSSASSSAATTTSADENILNMIENIGNILQKKIDVENPYENLFILDEKGRIPSLSTVLIQEIERYNKLLAITHESLQNLKRAIKGLVVMSENLEEIYVSLLNNQVPNLWSTLGFLSTKTLANWIIDFKYRIDYIQTWMNKGLPNSSWLSGLFFPQTFLTGTLQTHARRFNLPIDSLCIDFEVLSQHTILQSDVYQKHLNVGEEETAKIYSGLEPPDIGIIVHGLFIEAGRWDSSAGGLCDSKPGEITSNLPAIWFKPCTQLTHGNRYQAPLYKTQIRAGVLSTTGHSTNFVLSILLESKMSSDFWILRGTALITGITE